MRKSLIVLLSLIVVKETLAFGNITGRYIDPGTTAMVVGNSIWPLVVTIFAAVGGFVIKYFWEPIKREVSSVLGKLKRK